MNLYEIYSNIDFVGDYDIHFVVANTMEEAIKKFENSGKKVWKIYFLGDTGKPIFYKREEERD